MEDKMDQFKTLLVISRFIVLMGGLNLMVRGIFGLNLAALAFGSGSYLLRITDVILGLSALFLVFGTQSLRSEESMSPTTHSRKAASRNHPRHHAG
jgi:uncharacterized membrane protein YuzA (DUF378 family)